MNNTYVKLSEAELEILQVLWERGPSNVRLVHDLTKAGTNIGYTTTLKQLQLMLEKKLVGRDSSSKVHVYHSLINKERVQNQALSKFIDTVYNGSATRMVLQALGNHNATNEEIDLISDFLDKIKKEANGKSSR